MENLYLIVGLGNPGRRYARTRHNAGFRLVENLARRWKADWTAEKKFKSKLAWGETGGRKVLLCEPQTFMNLSGEAVSLAATFYRVALGRLLVAVDDADLPLGELRFRARGSSGGHHGLESLEQHLGTREFARLRLGIGRQADSAREITDYVLSEFAAEEQDLMERVLQRACEQVECWCLEGAAKAVSRFNGPVTVE